MTNENVRKLAVDLTEKEILKIERDVISVYRGLQITIEDELSKVYAKLAGISPDNAGYYNELLKRDRLNTLLKDLLSQYSAAYGKSAKLINEALSLGMANNYYRQLFITDFGLGIKFGYIPDSLIELAVTGTKEAWDAITESVIKKFGEKAFYVPKSGTLTDVIARNRQDDLSKLSQTLTRGVISGKPYTKMIDDVKAITGREIVKDGVKTYTGSKANAVRIIRTEGTRMMNAGAFAQTQYLGSLGIEAQKQWIATLDTATRERHANLDGVTIAPDAYFEIGSDRALYPGEFSDPANTINCRCTFIDIIPGLEPEGRTVRNPITGQTETYSFNTFDEWATANGLKYNSSGRLVQK